MLIHHSPTLSGKQSAPSPKRERDGKTLAVSYIIEAMWNFRVSYCPTLQHKVIINIATHNERQYDTTMSNDTPSKK